MLFRIYRNVTDHGYCILQVIITMITGWNCLVRLWTDFPQHKAEFQRLGFNFSPRKFSEDNGAQGKVPVLPAESVGIVANTKIAIPPCFAIL